jgi:hypothetical protein
VFFNLYDAVILEEGFKQSSEQNTESFFFTTFPGKLKP